MLKFQIVYSILRQNKIHFIRIHKMERINKLIDIFFLVFFLASVRNEVTASVRILFHLALLIDIIENILFIIFLSKALLLYK